MYLPRKLVDEDGFEKVFLGKIVLVGEQNHCVLILK